MSTTPGEIVRAERLRRGWSLREAGDAGGTSHSQWDRIERNEARREYDMRTAVARAFGWADDWVENPPPPPEVIQRDDVVLAEFRQWGETMLATMEAMHGQIVELQQAVARLAAEGQSAPPGRRRQS